MSSAQSQRVPYHCCPSSVGVHRGIRTAKDAPWTWAVISAQRHRFPFHCPEFGQCTSWLLNGQGASVRLDREFSPKPAGSLSLLLDFGRAPSWPPNGQGACLKLGHDVSPKSSGFPFTAARVRSGSTLAYEQPRIHRGLWALSVAQSQRVPFHCPEFGRGPSWLLNG